MVRVLAPLHLSRSVSLLPLGKLLLLVCPPRRGSQASRAAMLFRIACDAAAAAVVGGSPPVHRRMCADLGLGLGLSNSPLACQDGLEDWRMMDPEFMTTSLTVSGEILRTVKSYGAMGCEA
ncbi:hypothetical protein AXG93_1527s1000 [Marchantia polymorpha subsp. ruderalis]|uniref:Uncharacterized protein n=1 Tax=Marchantia polymorpha subsp. ruderalis TaxID=1480154 RepID=A0A176W9V4_MARPO|nr:hypothetical protein AXG93_1527s1000 [Marchantia polymorpha subsp. ruderalis]